MSTMSNACAEWPMVLLPCVRPGSGLPATPPVNHSAEAVEVGLRVLQLALRLALSLLGPIGGLVRLVERLLGLRQLPFECLGLLAELEELLLQGVAVLDQ